MKFKYFYTIPLLFLVMCLQLLISCADKSNLNRFNFGTENDSALYYYNKGWEHILDYGEWTKSEDAYRKARTFDPDFVLGKGIVGKITTDLEERLAIYNELKTQKVDITTDEHLLLNDLILVLKLFNSRDQGIPLDASFYTNFYQSSEKGMRTFIHKYPHESYIKAEYIEVLHAVHGAKTALDSIDVLATPLQKKLPFFLSYTALLESELGNFKNALAKANELKQIINNNQAPAVHYTFARLYLDMDSLDLAKTNIEKAIALDAKHQLAFRVKKRIDDKLMEKRLDTID